MKSGPEVAFVGMAFVLSSARNRLTRTGASPDLPIVIPSSKSEGTRPSADACEEVALVVANDIVGMDINDAPFVNIARRDEVLCYEVTKPLSGVGIEFVIIGGHHTNLLDIRLSSNAGPKLVLEPFHWISCRRGNSFSRDSARMNSALPLTSAMVSSHRR